MTTPRVNLLPHREARRERQKRVFWLMTGLSAVAGLLMIAAVWTVLQGYISNQESRNEFVRAENRKLDIQIKEIASLRAEIDGLRARQRAVEDLQADRNLPVYLIDEVAKQVPEGIYLRSIKQEDRRVNVSGWAASNERVSEFLRNLQNNSRVLERPELIEIKVAGTGPQGLNRRVFEFSLNFSLKQTPERALMQQAQPGAKSTLVPTTPVPTAVQSTPKIVSSSAPVAPEKK
ncbi:MAG TPA: PilN domain-containing protein [Burkholderiaceae bacterium]|nr:PilN domain-containing protein [Burkholderiaceae bacterium]